MNLLQHYYTPNTVEEALRLLSDHKGQAQIIGGGTDLLIDLQHGEGHEKPEALVDVTQITEMSQIKDSESYCYIGAAVTHTRITQSPLLASAATCLVESCGVVGGPQVRNVATLGGNVAHALPAGDGTTSLMALDAEVEIAWHDKDREWLPIKDIFVGPGQSIINTHQDVLVGFRFKAAQANQGTAFKRIMRPQGVALPVLGCAVWVEVDEAGKNYTQARVCIAPVAKTPVRATAIEEYLAGKPINGETLNGAVNVALSSLKPRTSKYRATAEYRTHMIETLLRQSLPTATERARTGQAIPEGVGLG